jgi:dTDP-glucose 4,6-dehydratase
VAPNSPYAATKASSDLVVLAYVHTFGFPAVITRCSNNYGPYQFPEKFIPLMIAQAMNGEKLPVYGDGQNVRDWIHVSDHCRALALVLERGRVGEAYNIGGDAELKNLDVVQRILQALGRSPDLVQFVKDRPGHDRRYAMDSSKLQRELGWHCRWNFEDGLRDTIRWYQENSGWLEATRSGQYRDYFDRHYVRRSQTFSSAR